MNKKKQVSVVVLATMLRASDLGAIILAGLVSYIIRYPDQALQTHDWLAFIAVTLVAGNIFHIYGLYNPKTLIARPLRVRKLFLAVATVAFLTLVVGYLTKTSEVYSRVWMTLWAASALVMLVAARLYFKFRLARWQAKGVLTRRIALVGAGPEGQRLIQQQAKNTDRSVSIIGVFDDRRSRVPSHVAEFKVRGTVSDLLSRINEERIDEIIVALPWAAENRINEILVRLRSAPVDIRLCPEGVAYRFADHDQSNRWGLGMLNAFDRPLKHWPGVIKAVEDRVLAALFLMFAWPLMLSIAFAIKLETRGPVIFKQRRYGFSKELIEVYKFRTLYHERTDWNDEKQVTKNDPRVTRVGAFLRASGLDELPQFFNVLKGNMSIVGPRPHPTQTKAGGKLFEDVVREYTSRHRVKPGITGWAQVNGWRGETDTEEKIRRRVEYDLYYIDRWSVWFDLWIIAMTPYALYFSKRPQYSPT